MDSMKLIRQFNKSILVKHINDYQIRGEFPDEWVLRIRNKKEKREHGEASIRFSANSDALLTPLQLYSKHIGEVPPETISHNLRRTFDVGTMWHEYIQSILIDMGFIDSKGVEKYIIKKIERNNKFAYASGIGDLVGVEIPKYGKWLVDIKTVNSKDFSNGIRSHMLDKYTAQVNLYGDWFGYDKLMILMVEKDSPHEFKELIIQKDENLIEDIYSRWVFAYQCILNKTPPEE